MTDKLNEWRVECDRCGREYYASKLRLEWTGLRVCHGSGTNDCWERKHPQLSIRARPDNQSVPWTRPEGEDVYVAACTVEGIQGIAGCAIADCAITEFTIPA